MQRKAEGAEAKLKQIKVILDFHAKQPKRAVRKIREVLENG